MQTLGNMLIAFRSKHNLNQSDLAKLIGVHRSTVNHIESGKRKASLKVITLINDSTRIPFADLIKGNEKNLAHDQKF